MDMRQLCTCLSFHQSSEKILADLALVPLNSEYGAVDLSLIGPKCTTALQNQSAKYLTIPQIPWWIVLINTFPTGDLHDYGSIKSGSRYSGRRIIRLTQMHIKGNRPWKTKNLHTKSEQCWCVVYWNWVILRCFISIGIGIGCFELYWYC